MSEPYRAILADPPWRFATRSDKGRGRSPDGPLAHYGTMTLDGIKALPVDRLAAPDCCLFLWATNPMLPQAFEVMAAWGFRYVTMAFCWAKLTPAAGEPGRMIAPRNDRIVAASSWDQATSKRAFHTGLGYWTRQNTESVLLGTRGRPKRLSASVRQLVVEPVSEHSAKPGVVRQRIMELVPGPYCELFARTRHPGFEHWGNEIEPRTDRERLVKTILGGM